MQKQEARSKKQEARSKKQEHYDAAIHFVKPPVSKPLVSIIVPVYNAEKYLVRCLDSLVGQTLREIEILCVNDGSTDSSSIILDEYIKKEPRIAVFHQENKGPGGARNTALDNTQGKYILFCDADDTLAPDAALECVAAMENNRVDIVVFNSNIIEVDRIEICKKNSSGQYFFQVQSKNEGILNQRESFKIALIPSVWGFCFRSDLIKHYNLSFPHYLAIEDVIFLLSYLMIIQSGYALNKSLYTYYVHKGSLASAAQGKHPWLERFIILPRLLGVFKFAIKNGKLFKVIYIFYWLFMWLRIRKMDIK
jgi:glycosyltransferase involved in cell wall biosynthesis